MSISFEKKIVFDCEVFPHVFVLSWQELKGYEKYGEPHSVYSPGDAFKIIEKNKDALWIGYNSNGYDDFIMSMIVNRSGVVVPEELSRLSKSIIEEGETMRMHKSFLSYDCFDPVEVGMRSLKMYCGSSGRSTYDSPYSFKEDRYYTNDEIKDIAKYCEEDVDYTTEVFLREKAYYEAALARVDILEDCGIKIQNPLKAICCRSAAFGRYLFQSLCGERDERDNNRTTIKFIRDYTTSPYEEMQSAFAFYKKIVDEHNELGDSAEFYNKDATPDFPNFTKEMGINLGWGGAHGAINGYKFKKDGDRALLYVDVSSMYPTLLVRHDLYPFTFSEVAKHVYSYNYRSRLTYKANGDAIKSQACKRIIASLTGMLKDKFATFRAEWSNNSITINGQLSILDMACRLRDVGDEWKIVQVNTDGVMVEVPDTKEAREKFSAITDEWCKDYNFEVSAKEIETLIQTNVNNYYMKIIGKDEEVLKGAAYSYNEGYFRDKTVVKKALVDCLRDGITPEEAIKKYTNIMDYLVLIKTTDTFPYLMDILSGEKKEARCIRVIATKNKLKNIFDMNLTPCYYVKVRRAQDETGTKVTNFPENAVELAGELSDYDERGLFEILDTDYYIQQIQRAIDIFNEGAEDDGSERTVCKGRGKGRSKSRGTEKSVKAKEHCD